MHGEEPEQLLMILVGTAGTGKTYIVNVVSRIARHLFCKNGAVLNLAQLVHLQFYYQMVALCIV